MSDERWSSDGSLNQGMSCDYEIWIGTKGTKSWIQVAEMSFFHKAEELHHSGESRVELLLLCNEGSQMS